MPFCEGLKKDLGAQQYAGEAVRVRIDDRDIRGGDKKWQWVKRGVPIRVEVGPRDIDGGTVFPARRDGVKCEKVAPAEFVGKIAATLAEIQQGLFDRAAKLRDDATVKIDSLAEFEKFFTPKNADEPEIHGGLAYSHFVDTPEIEEKLKELKVTVRCVPLDGEAESGKCIFTGKPSAKRGVFAKSY
jgi:prolyl-tRNA synthetase